MKVFKGKSLAPGYAEGQAYIYSSFTSKDLPKQKIDLKQVKLEIARLNQAVHSAIQELETIQENILIQLGEQESRIFESHLMLMKDEQFLTRVKSHISQELVNVEQAVELEISRLENQIRQAKSNYIKERSHDIRDIGDRVQKNLRRISKSGIHELDEIPINSVIVARELLPSDTIQFKRASCVAIVTERGGVSSHAAILASSLGLPMVTGVSNITRKINQGDYLLVNGRIGRVTLSPSKIKFSLFRRKKHTYDDQSAKATDNEFKECKTLDGIEIELLANIGRLNELGFVKEHNLSGIGLFRTEYLFMESSVPPKLREHFNAYRKAAQVLGNLPCTIRTLDLGGDKNPMFLHRDFESNPGIGLRGLRFSLANITLFKSQLRALLRASTIGNLRIMFPMVLGNDHLERAIDLVHSLAEVEKIDKLPLIGAMIETPAAVFEIEKLIKSVDFVSIGTNDLTQFILAADRGTLDMMDYCTFYHPAVLQAIYKVIQVANANNLPVSVCGEAAGDAGSACLLIGLGARSLSMSPIRAARIRERIRRIKHQDLTRLAKSAMSCGVRESVILTQRFLEQSAYNSGQAQNKKKSKRIDSLK